jgi:O-acetyl-ADP-ribose deacetylase (regulator of RNase III)
MRVPDDARWDREIVYECVWSLLCAVDNHNRTVRAAGDDREEIRSILMTPLGTGIGRITPERWASQAVLALKHFHDACANPEKWSKIGWTDAEYYSDEVEKTWKEDRDEGNSGSWLDHLKSR